MEELDRVAKGYTRGGKTIARVVFTIDTADELPVNGESSTTVYVEGSAGIAINEGAAYILNSERVWKKWGEADE